MLKKIVLSSVAAGMLTFGLLAAEVYVKIAPPHAVVETRGHAPGEGYVWTNGYHRWDGNVYVWVPGEWRRPPHERARWVDHRWEHRKEGYVFVEGRWK
jgi:hypothetical protein